MPEELLQTQLLVPAYQIGLLLLVSTIALLFGKMRLALILNYLFTLYWGYILNRSTLLGSGLENLSNFTAIYFGFGLAIAVLAAFSFLIHGSQKA
ncbi:MAG: hypothetical protein AB1921_12920 [Thermodesulfobacteriota bacterium]